MTNTGNKLKIEEKLLNSTAILVNTVFPGAMNDNETSLLDEVMMLNSGSGLLNLGSDDKICGSDYENPKIEKPSDQIISDLKKCGLKFEDKSGHPSFSIQDGWKFVATNANNENLSNEAKQYLSTVFDSAIKKNQENNQNVGRVLFIVQMGITIVGIGATVFGGSVILGMTIAGIGMGLQRMIGMGKQLINKKKADENKQLINSIKEKQKNGSLVVAERAQKAEFALLEKDKFSSPLYNQKRETIDTDGKNKPVNLNNTKGGSQVSLN